MTTPEIVKLAIDGAIAAVRVVESIIASVDTSEAQTLAEVRERLEQVRARAEALPIRAGESGDWARRAEERRREIEG